VHPNDPLNHCSDEDLLSRLKNGERDVFGTLVRRYERELYGYLRRYTGDAELAEDVFQTTFLQIFTKIEQYEIGRAARPWIYTIATHQAIDAMRRTGRKAMVSLEQSAGANEDGEPRGLLNMLEAPTDNPAQRMLADDRQRLVRESLDQLPDSMKQVVLLTYYQGMKYREAADALGIPVGTVKSRLHAALAKLQEIWNGIPSLKDE
jgi:RNA polymerase sigma-70 factor (ECF subfamily)